jgi:predicted  nucleic acid-binding Zn-ribbon protein
MLIYQCEACGATLETDAEPLSVEKCPACGVRHRIPAHGHQPASTWRERRRQTKAAKRKEDGAQQLKAKREERATEPHPKPKAETKPKPEANPEPAPAEAPRPRPRRARNSRAWHRPAATLPSVANVLRAAGLACWASAVIVPALVLAFGEESSSAGVFLVETVAIVGGLAILGALCLGAGEMLVCLRSLVRDMRQVRETLAAQDHEEETP